MGALSRPDDRQQVALQRPTAERIDGFPACRIRSTKTLYRAHSTRFGPWFFSSNLNARFDLAAPSGTCYLAESRAAALRESLGVRLVVAGVVDQSEVAGRQVSELHLPVDVRAANSMSARAAAHGITKEICTITPYDVPQRWAKAWSDAGFGGVRYSGRFSTTMTADARCLALFGPAGPAPSEYHDDPGPLPAKQVAVDAGIKVVDALPTVSTLTVIRTPGSRP